jgi:hypothetical protein
MDEGAEIFCWWAVVAGERGEAAQLAVFDSDKSCGGDASAVQEGGVLEGAGLLDADVEAEGGVCDLFKVSGIY